MTRVSPEYLIAFARYFLSVPYYQKTFMITEEQLRQLYDTELRASLSGIERRRLEIKLLVPVGTIACLVAFYHLFFNGFNLYSIVLLPVFIGSAIWGAYRFSIYRKKFKTEVAGRIIHLVNPEWVFEDSKFVPEKYYKESNLIRELYLTYRGDNLITGIVDDTIFECSEFYLERRERTGNSKGNIRLFQGLFMKMDFEKGFTRETYITGKVACNKTEEHTEDALALRLAGSYPKKLPLSEVEVAHASFNQHFVMHTSTNGVPPVGPGLMDALVKMQETLKKEIYISFMGKRAYCVIRFKEYDDLFEPRVYKTGVSFEDIKAMYDIVRLIETTAVMLSKHA